MQSTLYRHHLGLGGDRAALGAILDHPLAAKGALAPLVTGEHGQDHIFGSWAHLGNHCVLELRHQEPERSGVAGIDKVVLLLLWRGSRHRSHTPLTKRE